MTEMIRLSAIVRRSSGSVIRSSLLHQPGTVDVGRLVDVGRDALHAADQQHHREPRHGPDHQHAHRPVASGVSTSHAVVPSVIPSPGEHRVDRTAVRLRSSSATKLSVVRPMTYGRKTTVRISVDPRRLPPHQHRQRVARAAGSAA